MEATSFDLRCDSESNRRIGISVIVPTLNEADNIDLLLAEVLSNTRQFETEVLVADGGSTDGTRARVEAWAKRAPVRLIEPITNQGLSGDVLEAARAATHDIIVVMDADMSHPPATIAKLVEPIQNDQKDMVVGSRYVDGGSTPNWPRLRRLLSRAGGAMAWPIADIRDPMSGFFATRKSALLSVDPDACGFKIGLEVLAAAPDQFRVGEVPIEFRDRIHGQSKIGWSQMSEYFRRLLTLSGGSVSLNTAARFVIVGMAGIFVDLFASHSMLVAGFSLAMAHMTGFALATLFNYGLNSRWAFVQAAQAVPESEVRRYFRFFAICLLALFFRGGVLALAVNSWGWPAQPAIILAVASAALINYLGNAFFVFVPEDSRSSSTVRRWRIAAIGVFAYVIALRLVFIGATNLLPEESYYWNYSQHLDIGYLDHPPMIAWVIWLGTHVLGNTEFGVRLGASFTWLLGAYFSFQLARNLYGKSAALVCLLLYATLPFFFTIGFLMFPDGPLTAAWAGGLYFLERATLGNNRHAWWGVGIAVGMGMLSKYTIALLVPATLAFLILHASSRHWLVRPGPYIALTLAALLFSPAVIWNYQHDWASFAFQSSRRLSRSVHFSLPKLIGSALVLLTPIGLAAAIASLAPKFRGHRWLSVQDGPSLFVTVFTVVPLSVFIAFSLFHQTSLNWTGPVWLAALPLVAHNIINGSLAVGRLGSFMQRSWTAAVVTLLLIYGGTLHYLALGLPGISQKNSLRSFTAAWSEFGHEAESIEREVEKRTGKEPLLVGLDKYRLASQLAFYDGGDNDGAQDTAGRNLFGQGGLMYNYWTSPKSQDGKVVVLFSLSEEKLRSDTVTAHFQTMDPVRRRDVYKAHAPAGHFYYRVGYNFRSG